MNTELQNKYDKLREIISGFKSVIVAYSGGLDSAFLLYAAAETLGAGNVTAITADSASIPRSELEAAIKFASSLGLQDRHKIIETAELYDPSYAANPTDRCFYCKQELFTRLNDIAKLANGEIVLDGYNADDVGDFRPGRKAAVENSVRSPLFEAGLRKSELRELAKYFELSIWDKPQMACLASRIPYGSQVTKAKLSQVEQAEAYLRELGFVQMRVRHHDKLARIELTVDDINKVITDNLRDRIMDKFRKLGFVWVTLDLAGFRSGSMNEALDGSEKDV
jgi:pyridinium-3,5-biscarboxylic acid mononucleotide sulfurtransferase